MSPGLPALGTFMSPGLPALVARARRFRCAKDTVVVKNVFTRAGWTFNDSKETSPSQEVYYLGFYYDSVTQKYRVHENKIRQVERRIQELEGKRMAKP